MTWALLFWPSLFKPKVSRPLFVWRRLCSKCIPVSKAISFYKVPWERIICITVSTVLVLFDIFYRDTSPGIVINPWNLINTLKANKTIKTLKKKKKLDGISKQKEIQKLFESISPFKTIMTRCSFSTQLSLDPWHLQQSQSTDCL